MLARSFTPGPCLLIDDAGCMRRWPDQIRGATFGYTDPDFDFVDYAVRNLGHVMIAERARFVRIKLRPLFVSRRTRAALSTYLVQHAPARVVLSMFTGAWSDTLLSFADARQRLDAILDAGEREQSAPSFIAVRRKLASILENGNDPFAPVLRRWLDGTHPENAPAFLDAYGLYDRTMIAEHCGDTGAFEFRHSGNGLRLYGPSWPTAAPGRRIEDQPDRSYGEWIAEACRSVDALQVPRLELIDAHIGAAGRPARRWRYERLMLPSRSAAGRRQVISISRPERP